jgi:hypothetical protein
VAGRFTCVVQPVFRKFNRKSMKRTFVQASNKSLYHLFGNEFQLAESLYALTM